MRVFKRLLISSLIGLTGFGTAQADLTAQRINATPIDLSAAASKSVEPGIYIVQMDDRPVIAYEGTIRGYQATKPGKGEKINPKSAHVKKYAAFLKANQNQAIDSVGAEKVYSYRYAFNGFAARMTADDANALRKRANVVNVWKDEIRQLQTDGSPDYIGLTEAGEAWSKGRTGENVVIGVIDTGVWPEHPSFADVPTDMKGNKGPEIPYGPPPAGFTSSGCDFGNTAANEYDAPYECTNKLLTARCYNLGFSSAPDESNPCGGDGADTHFFEFQSARDFDGHGSHTASTSGGNSGVSAYIDGQFQGVVSGIAPRARLAAYKVCWDGPDLDNPNDDGCASSDSAAAIDQAVFDGVDVINFSIGGSSNTFSGADDIAFLFAADAGVFVATSNGNSGPGAGTVGTPSGVPWITAVGATQDDGVFSLRLDVSGDLSDSYFALQGSGPVRFDTDYSGAMVPSDPLDGCSAFNNSIGGEIALVIRGACSFVTKYDNAAAAGASAIIVYNNGGDPITMSAPGTTIPGAMIATSAGEAIESTVSGGGSVTGTIGPGTAVSQANRIAGYSSRGPNNGALDIIKPDVSAPGSAILAAESPFVSGELFQSINGTSMASPHAAGAFAQLKQVHPEWSAAIARSALMTTARQGLLKTLGSDPADPFDIGAGEILPSDAYNPGLAYDAGLFEYAAFSCENNYQIFSDASCEFLESIGIPSDGSDLNLPSIGIGALVGSQTITRTVTGVYNNRGKKIFHVSVDAPPGIDVSVSPSRIKLGKDETADYQVTFSVSGDTVMDEWTFGSLTWTDQGGIHSVRSPIAIFPTESTNATLFTKTVDSATASSGDTLTYEINVTNGPVAGPITVTDVVPAGTTFVPASETESVVNGSTTAPWAYDGGSNSLSWEGALDVSSISVEASPAPYGYFSLGDFGIAPFGCPSNCDDGAFALNVPSYTYNGVSYSSVIWSVNGTVEAGTESGVGSSYANQNLPDATPPNNLFAPFWRDLNLGAGGEWYVAILGDGVDEWTIYEWENVPIFGDNSVAYTFQIWVGNDGFPSEGRIWYTYDRIDNTDDGTVGAENSAGTVGDSYFYDGAGTAPVVGTDLEVIVTPGGTATLGFQVVTDCSEDAINIADLSSNDVDESASATTTCP